MQEFIERAKEYIEFKELTPEIMRAFIKKILIYGKELYTRNNTIVIQDTFQIDEK